MIGIAFLTLYQRYIVSVVCKQLRGIFSSLVIPVWQLSFFNLGELLVPLARSGHLDLIKYFSELKFPISRCIDDLAIAAAAGSNIFLRNVKTIIDFILKINTISNFNIN
jgi:hypothetical protein